MITSQLTKFREKFPHTKAVVYDDYITYKVKDGTATSASERANKLIDDLKLNLVAIPTKGHRGDTFIIKSSEVEL